MFISTAGRADAVGLAAALSAGLAPDGGLYLPASLPRMQPADFDGADNLVAIGTRLLAPYFDGDPLADSLEAICADALAVDPPLTPLADHGAWLLELFHGPTAAFKDYGARFLAACLARLRHAGDPPLTIVVATSGDTGAAVAAAFHAQPGFRVAILYPEGRVSPRQAHHLGAFGGNVRAFAVAGTFDDCQRLAKQALADRELARKVPMTSANSISLGRLLPQMTYHVAAALRHWRGTGSAADFIVPTGNLGNALAAIMACLSGLPIADIALATNANRTLPEFFAGGDYTPRDAIATLANAMDVGAPSNFARLAALFPDAAALRDAVFAEAVDDDEIRATLRTCRERHGKLVCPHTATALRVFERRRERGIAHDTIIVATAHPAKFESVIEPLIGEPIPLPPDLTAFLARPSRHEQLAADYAAFSRALVEWG